MMPCRPDSPRPGSTWAKTRSRLPRSHRRPGAYRIRMPHRTAEALGLDGDTGRGERMIGVKLGEPVTVLDVTRGPQWTTVTIRAGASRPYVSIDPATPP